MPELPEIEVLRRSLEPLLVGRPIARVEVRERRLREPVRGAQLARTASGREVLGLRRRGEVPADRPRGRRDAGGPPRDERAADAGAEAGEPLEPHEHVAFYLASGRRLRLRDPRRFGLAVVVPTAEIPRDPHFSHLGVEPLEPGFAGELLAARRPAGGGRSRAS